MTKKEWWTVPPASTTPWWWPGSIWATTKAPYPWWWDKATPEQEVAWKGGHNIRGSVGFVGGPYDKTWGLIQEGIQEAPFEEKSKWTGEQFEAQMQQQMLQQVTTQGHTRGKGSSAMNSPTGQAAIFLDESSPGMCNCPVCPKEVNVGGMPWEQEDWGNPWDKFMTPN